MITAFLLVIALNDSLQDTRPSFKAAYDHIEQCLHVAYKLNTGSQIAEDHGSIEKGFFHFCVEIRFPT